MNQLGLALAAVLCASVVCTGCRGKADQITVESRTAFALWSLVKEYGILHPDVPITNLAQVFEGTGREYPHDWDREFRMYGRYAGFTNSVLEKYAVVPPGSTVRIAKGEILMLNAQPFPDRDGGLGRFFVFKPTTNSSDLARWWYPESEVQRIFKDAQKEIPKPSPVPTPPPEPPTDETSRKAAEALLKESYRRNPVPIWCRPAWQAAGVVVVLCAALYGFFRLARRP